MWNYLLYVKENIPECWREQPYWDRLCCNLSQHGVSVVELNTIYSTENLRAQLQDAGIPAEEGLLFAWRETELAACQTLSLANVAYECREVSFSQGDLGKAQMLLLGLEETDYTFLLRVYQRKHNIPWEILRTRRCILRELCMQDIDALYELYDKPGITNYVEPLYEKDEEEEYQRQYIANIYGFYGYGMWLVFDRNSGTLMGRAGLEHRLDEEGKGVLEMGYLIAPEYQRQGYGGEVCAGILSWAEANLDFPAVRCLVQRGNTASEMLLKRLGFSRDGSTWQDGKEYLCFVYVFRRKAGVCMEG
ncbi:MAG: GNAT family N-acetyltransferase [Lachnospiraceae bacterium]|nr:GNAT family N-acetyltransferase [Lachnospiraceae bacterium]